MGGDNHELAARRTDHGIHVDTMAASDSKMKEYWDEVVDHGRLDIVESEGVPEQCKERGRSVGMHGNLVLHTAECTPAHAGAAGQVRYGPAPGPVPQDGSRLHFLQYLYCPVGFLVHGFASCV